MGWHATTSHGARRGPTVVAGLGAVVLGDVILGSAAFSTITLGSLWYFAWEWIQLRGEYLARGLPFGSTWQLALAWLGVVAALPLLVLTVALTVRALELPRRLFRYLRGEPSEPKSPVRAARTPRRGPASPRVRPDYIAGFWAAVW